MVGDRPLAGFDHPHRQRITIHLTVRSFDRRNDRHDQLEDDDGGDEKNPDQNEDQNPRDDEVYEYRELKVQGLPAVILHVWILVAFDQPDEERPKDVDACERQEMGSNRPPPRVRGHVLGFGWTWVRVRGQAVDYVYSEVSAVNGSGLLRDI